MMAGRRRIALLQHGAPAAVALFLATNLVPQSILVHHHPGGGLPHVHPFGEASATAHPRPHPHATVASDGHPALGVPGNGDHVHCQQPYQASAKPAVPGLVPAVAVVRVDATTLGTPPSLPSLAARSRGPPLLPSAVFDQI